MIHEFWQNIAHNLFRPRLLFFYFGFLIPIMRVRFEFPYVVYQGLTMYLLLAIGWHGGEELAKIKPSTIGTIAGFIVVGFVVNFLIGTLAYFLLSCISAMRRVERATIAGYYGSDSAGTFATCVAALTSAGIAFNAYMPVMLAIMEIPGCLVALYLVARLRQRGMDPLGNMPDEPGYNPRAKPGPGAATQPATATHADTHRERRISQESDSAPAQHDPQRSDISESGTGTATASKPRILSRRLLQEVFLNPGLCLLVGGIVIGFISESQGHNVVRDDDNFFVAAFQGALCLFLLEMGMTAARKLKDLKAAGFGFMLFGLLAPNLFATLGIIAAHAYAHLTETHLMPGTYVLFAVLCAAASYITVPAVQRLAIPEASPTVPLAASLGLTFTYNVTIGIPLYTEIARVLGEYL